ncbi:MAG: hypothetical protein ACI81R_000647 [Bradymonadia bacterium]|jgi:hypothetical protein
MMTSLWLATLAALAPVGPAGAQAAQADVHDERQSDIQGEQHCEVEATVLGWADYDTVQGIERVSLLLDGVQARGCSEHPSVVLVAGMTGTLQLALAPAIELGVRYRFPLFRSSREAVYIVRLGEPLSELIGGVTGELPLSGNNVPACRRDQSARWAGENVVVEMEPRGREGISVEELRVALEDAARTWRAPVCSSANFEVALGSETADWALRADGRSTFAFIDEESSLFGELGLADGLGFTCWVCDEDGYILEADVRLEGRRTLWSTGCTAEAFDVRGTALHEFGHVLGIGHAPEADAAMFGFTSPRRLLSRRGLSRWDADGVCDRYPCGTEDCGEATTVDVGCPIGEGLCAACGEGTECGAETDLCLNSSDGGRCGRECSPSFPCPEGYGCVSVDGASSQCVFSADSCPDQAWVGALCASDDECGRDGDECLSSGVCGASCADGGSCRDGAECVVDFDPDGIVSGAQCIGDALPLPPRGDKGCGCNAVAPRPVFWFVGLLIWIRRRCR